MAQLNVDFGQIKPQAGFETIPKGWYKIMAEHSEIKPTSKGDGAYLEVRFTILEGQFANRKLFARFNLRNSNAQAQEIGFAQLSALAHATGILQVADSTQLHNIPIWARVKIREGEGNYDDSNDITSYRNINDPPASVASAGPAGQPAVYAAPPPAGQPPSGWAPPAQQPAQQMQPPAQYPPQGQPPAQQPAQPWGQQPPTQPQQPWAGQPAPGQPPAQQAPQQPTQQPPAGWTPPAGGQPWGVQPQAQPNAQQPPAQPQQPPHPAQSSVPPWQRPQQ